ncbi:hypothetical protein REPUB_Repub20aG0018400 [Reevesia pubescens]
MELFQYVDMATEILFRLPAKTLLAFKLTSKRWNTFISDPSFLHIHSQKCRAIDGLFLQEYLSKSKREFDCLNYLSISKVPYKVSETVLDFLPEKVVVVASCNGLLCCRSIVAPLIKGYHKPLFDPETIVREQCQKGYVIYICDPATKEWISVKPLELCPLSEALGLAITSGLSFKLVSIHPLPNDNPTTYSFRIYSSETNSWKTSKELCKLNSKIYPNRMVFVSGRFHWVTYDHRVITFDLERELSQVLELPGRKLRDCSICICVGESEGCFHYVVSFFCKLLVWMLKDYDEPKWVLKHTISIVEFCQEHSSQFNPKGLLHKAMCSKIKDCLNPCFSPLAFHDEVLFLVLDDGIFSYNFKTRTLLKHWSPKGILDKFHYHFFGLPYSPSLLSPSNFKVATGQLIGNRGKASREQATLDIVEGSGLKQTRQLPKVSAGGVSKKRSRQMLVATGQLIGNRGKASCELPTLGIVEESGLKQTQQLPKGSAGGVSKKRSRQMLSTLSMMAQNK